MFRSKSVLFLRHLGALRRTLSCATKPIGAKRVYRFPQDYETIKMEMKRAAQETDLVDAHFLNHTRPAMQRLLVNQQYDHDGVRRVAVQIEHAFLRALSIKWSVCISDSMTSPERIRDLTRILFRVSTRSF